MRNNNDNEKYDPKEVLIEFFNDDDIDTITEKFLEGKLD